MAEFNYKVTVITPVYNAERFLAETIESVIAQSLGFESIQLILINDGSTDGSSEICRHFADEYPKNILYIEKDNGGVSSARNAGLEHVSGKYIIFLDADDRWDAYAFARIYEFFEAHPKAFDVCSCRIKFSGDYEDKNHPLDYKFADGTRITDLTEEPAIISSTIGSVAVRAASVGDIRFNEKISAGEDSVFVNSLLLEHPYLGVLPDALFYYRRNYSSGSGSSSASHKVSWYTVVPREYYLGLCNRSIERYGKVLPFIQYVIMYDLRWRRYDQTMMLVLTEEEKQQHISIMKEVLSYIPDKVIRKAEGFTQYRRLYLLMLKHGYDVIGRAELQDGILRYKKIRLFNFNLRNVIRITVFDFDRKKLTIEGVCGIKGLANEYSLFAKDDRGNTYSAVLKPFDKRDVRGFVGEYIVHGESFHIELPVSGDMSFSLVLKIGTEGIHMVPSTSDYLRISDISKTGVEDYCFREGYIIKNNKGKLTVIKDTPINRLKAESLWRKTVKIAGKEESESAHRHELTLARIMRSAKAGNQVVFISGRDDDVLQDNLQLVYDRINLPKIYYSKRDIYTDPDMYENAAELICAAKVVVTDDYLPVVSDYRKVQGQHIVQLWHASGAFKHFGKDAGNKLIARDKLYHRDYDLVTVSAEGIRKIYANSFQIPENIVKATGVARTDLLFDENHREEALRRVYLKHPELKGRELILYAPTFRDVPGLDRSKFTPDLDFKVLSKVLGENRVFVLCPHPIMTESVIKEDLVNVIEIRDVTTADMMFAASLLVTDYSSVIFEFALMGKPMVFYCYDYDTYERDFYLDMERDLPGPLLTTQEELYEYISTGAYDVSEGYGAFCDKYMGACDGHSTERIAELIDGLYHDRYK